MEQNRASVVLPHHPDLAGQAADQLPDVHRTDRFHHDQDWPEAAPELDTRGHPKGITVSEAEVGTLNIEGDTYHPEWNYTIAPRVPP